MLELKDVTISYKKVPTVQQFNMSMKQGQIISLVGESGSGKTTLGRFVAAQLGYYGDPRNFGITPWWRKGNSRTDHIRGGGYSGLQF